MVVNPNAGLYDAYTNLGRNVETAWEKGRYSQWYSEMIDYASKSQFRSNMWSALSIINPVLGLAANTIDTAITSANMPETFDLDPDLMYSDKNVVSDYSSGSQEAIYELENSLWTGLMSQTRNIFAMYGSPYADVYDAKGKPTGEREFQWGGKL